jgi:hypothetical protein
MREAPRRMFDRDAFYEGLASAEQADRAGGIVSYMPMIQRSGKLVRLDLTAMLQTDPPPIPWVVDRIVARGALTLLAGVAGEGKSLLTMAWSLAAASAEVLTVAGVQVEPGRVVIVDAENGQREIHRRVRALAIATEAVDRLALFEASGFDLSRDLAELETVLAELRPSLLILDSFRSLWGGNEREEAEVAAVLDPLRNLIRKHNAGTILIHHARRDGTGYRGSGAIAASCELAFLLNRAEGDTDQGRRRLHCEKSRPAPEPADKWLRLASEADLASGIPLIAEAEPFAGGGHVTKQAAVAAQAVELIEVDGPMHRADVGRRLGLEPNNGTLRRGMEAAVNDGRLIPLPGGAYDVASHDGNPAGNPANQVASLPRV